MVRRRNAINEGKKETKNKKVKNCNPKKAGKSKKKKITNGVKSVKTKAVTAKKINVKPANKNK